MVMPFGTSLAPAASLIWTVTPKWESKSFSASPTFMLPLIFSPSALVLTSLEVFFVQGGQRQVPVGDLRPFVKYERQTECLFEVCRDGFELFLRSYGKLRFGELVQNVVQKSHGITVNLVVSIR